MKVRSLARTAAAALLVGIMAGCAQAGSSAPAPVAASAVDLPPSYRFAPADISVGAGTTVTWTNTDAAAHSVTFDGGAVPASGTVDVGTKKALTMPTAAGTYAYKCTFHPNMSGSVVVQ